MLAFSAISGPPTVNLLGNTPIGFSALRGLGSYTSDTPCNAISTADRTDPNLIATEGVCKCSDGSNYAVFNDDGTLDTSACTNPSGNAPDPNASASGGGFWSNITSAFATGVTRALVTNPTTGVVTPVIITPPWYTQWWGMAAIGIGVIGAGSLLLGKPKTSPAAAVAGLFGIGKRRRRRR